MPAANVTYVRNVGRIPVASKLHRRSREYTELGLLRRLWKSYC